MLALARTALKAGQKIMDFYDSGARTSLKADNSPVTEADIAAEKIILAGLASLDPDTPVIAEEAVAGGKTPRTAPRFYLVDPLDGTREFISRNGEFTVNIALVENGAPVAGVIYVPVQQRLYCGEAANGAHQAKCSPKQDPAAANWQVITTPRLPANNLIAAASRSHSDEKTTAWLKQRGVSKTISAGSSLKFCLVATGKAHLYPRFGRTMEWDTAAGHAIVTAAGGNVTTEDGAPLTYGKEDRGFDNPPFFVSAPA